MNALNKKTIEDIEEFDFDMYLYSILGDVTENVK